jgi:hypothetical protein
MAKSSQEIIEALAELIKLEGSEYDQWFIGAAADGAASLFGEHGVVQDVNWYFMEEAGSPDDAAATVKHFAGAKMDGGKASGGKVVYAFRKRPNTKPAGPAKPSHGEGWVPA